MISCLICIKRPRHACDVQNKMQHPLFQAAETGDLKLLEEELAVHPLLELRNRDKEVHNLSARFTRRSLPSSSKFASRLLQTALIIAARCGQPDVIKRLLQVKASVAAMDAKERVRCRTPGVHNHNLC